MAGRSTEALRHRDFALFWWSALVSNTGGWVQHVTIPFVLYRLTGSAAWVGLASFAQFSPAFFLGPLAGSLADRFSRRRILLATQTALAGVGLALWGLWLADLATPGTIVVVVTVGGVVAGLSITAWQAFVTELVPRSVLPNAVTLNSAQFNASRALGPALGGLVLAALGPGWAFLINALSFAAVILALLAIADRPAAAPSFADHPGVRREFAATIRYVRARPGLTACVVAVVLLGVLGSPVISLTVVFAEDVFGVGRVAYGFLGACLGLGAILGAPVVSGWAADVPRGRVVAVSLPLYGAALVVFGAAPAYAVGAGALLVAGGAYLAVAAALNTALQLQVDEGMRGKVLSVYLMAFTAAIPIGGLAQGALVDLLGPRPTVVGAGTLLVVAALWLTSSGRTAGLDASTPASAALSVDGAGDERSTRLAAIE